MVKFIKNEIFNHFVKNINKEVWRYLDNHITIKKNLADGLINSRALAKKIMKDLNHTCSISSVISAIRRYDLDMKKDSHLLEVYKSIKRAKLFTRTKLVSLLLKKNERIREKLASLYKTIDFLGGDTLRIFEVNKYIKIIVDEKTLIEAKRIFKNNDIVNVRKDLGELSVAYNSDITKIPGVFALLSNELAAGNVSIIDSMICYSEHLIILDEKDIQKGFQIVFELTTKQ